MSQKIHNFMENRPEHVKALGLMLANWGVLEQSLVLLLMVLLKVDQSRARLIFYNFVSFSGKLELIERLIHFYVEPSKEKAKLLEMTNKAKKLSTERNALVHATWGLSKNEKEVMLIPGSLHSDRKKRSKPFVPKTVQDIQSVADRISELSGDLMLLHIQRSGTPQLQVSDQPIE